MWISQGTTGSSGSKTRENRADRLEQDQCVQGDGRVFDVVKVVPELDPVLTYLYSHEKRMII